MRTSVHVYARVRNERTIRIVRVTYYETLTSTLNFEAISSFGSVNKPPPTIAILAIHVLFLFFTFFPCHGSIFSSTIHEHVWKCRSLPRLCFREKILQTPPDGLPAEHVLF